MRQVFIVPIVLLANFLSKTEKNLPWSHEYSAEYVYTAILAFDGSEWSATWVHQPLCQQVKSSWCTLGEMTGLSQRAEVNFVETREKNFASRWKNRQPLLVLLYIIT